MRKEKPVAGWSEMAAEGSRKEEDCQIAEVDIEMRALWPLNWCKLAKRRAASGLACLVGSQLGHLVLTCRCVGSPRPWDAVIFPTQ